MVCMSGLTDREGDNMMDLDTAANTSCTTYGTPGLDYVTRELNHMDGLLQNDNNHFSLC